MIILGLNAYHPDSAACVLIDGHLIAAAEEERFKRIKHWAGLPIESIRYCLREADVKLSAVSHIAINRNPMAHWWRKLPWLWSGDVVSRVRNVLAISGLRQDLEHTFDCIVTAKLHHIHHHRAHFASAFLCSPFPSASVVSVDGFGDGVSTMWGHGDGARLWIADRVYYPHSLGVLYTAVTQFLGFYAYGDEYKVMGLAAYGKPEYLPHLRKLIRLKPCGKFELNLAYFQHHTAGTAMTWKDREPTLGRLFSPNIVEILGPSPESIVDARQNMAASLQALYQEIFVHILSVCDSGPLCLAGGCALNSVANGLIKEPLYIPPVPHDAGGALGAALSVWCERLGHPRRFVLDRADWGPHFDPPSIQRVLHKMTTPLLEQGIRVAHLADYQALCLRVAKDLARGRIIGWYQGRLEFGPRALGSRSILADPRKVEVATLLNLRIKDREAFRPFAPVVLEEEAADWFDLSAPSPLMTLTVPVRPDKRGTIPAVTHVDGSARVQTVNRQQNPLLYSLLRTFASQTDCPVLLNTSLNEHEPIVCTPSEAIDCFLRTKLDALAIGPYYLMRAVS